MRKASILVVDDDPLTLDFIIEFLEESGFGCRKARNGIEALDIMQNETFDIVIANVHMPRMDGLELMSKAREIAPSIPFIITCGYLEDHPPDEILEAGAQGFLKKPFKPSALKDSVNRILRQCKERN